MSSAVTTAGQEIKAVGGPLHTVILVMLLIGGASLMYFSAGTRKARNSRTACVST